MKAELSAIVLRGTTVDSYLEAWLRRAVRGIERTYTFAYMKGFAEFEIDHEAVTPRSLAMPTGLRRLTWVRILDESGELQELKQVEPEQIHQRLEGRPQAYWVASRTTLWFDKTPMQTYNGEWAYEAYTTWSSADSFEPWLFANADDLVLYQAALLAAAHTKNDGLTQRYAPLREEAWRALLQADEDFSQGNASHAMQYGSRMLDQYSDADVEED